MGFWETGDEATAVNEQWMFLMFTSDLCPAPGNSASSRFLCAILPSQRYVLTVDKTNLTLQAACWEITQSFNKLSNEGLVLNDLPSMGGGPVP